MRMISYAQNGEDVLLDRLFPRSHGFYIDVGANEHRLHSVTKHFYDRGWHGINIEPVPALHQALCVERPRDLNLGLGISNREGSLTFYEAEAASGWSTFSAAQAESLRQRGLKVVEHSIPVMTLARVCEQFVPPGTTIDFLKIDAENHEKEVMEGANWSRWRPRAILIEANGAQFWERPLLDSGYSFAFYDGINLFYIRDEEAYLISRLDSPANLRDDFVIDHQYQQIEELQRRLDQYQELGPATLTIARALKRTAQRVPGLLTLGKTLLGHGPHRPGAPHSQTPATSTLPGQS